MGKNVGRFLFSLIVIYAYLFAIVTASADVSLHITKGYSEVISSSSDAFGKQLSVLRFLMKSHEVGTAFGGNFVVSVDNLPAQSRQGNSWFYYVNGIFADVGAAEFTLKDRDHVWWDYHSWKDAVKVGALVGAFPQPFLSGYRGTLLPTELIVHESLIEEGKNIVKMLREVGVSTVSLETFYSDVSWDSEAYRIVVVPWSSAIDHPDIAKLYARSAKTGFTVRFVQDGVYALDSQGNSKRHCQDGGVILALNPLFSTRPIWIVTGTSVDQTARAARILGNESKALQGKVGVVLCGEERWNVPIAAK